MSVRSFELAREVTSAGAFQRQQSGFRGLVEERGDASFRAEPGRYHLYLSLACPWSHRVVLARMFKQLEQIVGIETSSLTVIRRAGRSAPAATRTRSTGFKCSARPTRRLVQDTPNG